MELLLRKKSKKLLLDYLAQSSQRVGEEIARVEQLYEALVKKGESNAFLKVLVDKLSSSIAIPDPPLPPDSENLPQKLEEYEKDLKALEETLRQTLNFLERVEKIIPEAEKAAESVDSYIKIISPLNPSMASEAAKSVARVRRLQEALMRYPRLPLLADLEKGVEDLDRVEKALRSEYEKALGFILRELTATREITRRALAVAVLQEKSQLERDMEDLNKMEQELVELKAKPQPIDTQRFYSELGRIKTRAGEILQRSLAHGEARVFEALLWLAASSESKVMEFSDLVDTISRRGGVSTSETLSALYKLSKSGAVKVVARVLG
ncbi:hypothetical protein IG193_03420 [Infirmifilum lucidum]|uniref:Uncharacterized protein n=1 Tax=Infirmifilum lucidum TaxID=2776706 RepID=A0A7L9FKH4_9CREN|nr:hypothetical protein [Infirmifilum lucidum]QOJ79523.1 hypothetical protein IG193_03420 [Infirmifilum lucidum]